ncbi:hypothetical protein V1525DRAFT_414753 [Lipomyces kononenkoae]|uniref:Uncharacterized protein n=1 Tax=Lipomyces kononenkoae TaxID=34357 RepID=A0ACC3SRD3_LIPKO
MNKYYDIDDILTDGHKIPVVFQLTVPGMGYLEHERSSSSDIKQGARIELPLWLAEMLAIGGISDELPTGFITVSTPAPFNNKVLNALSADPGSVDLRGQSMQFYKFAERWLAMTGDNALLDTIMDTFKARAAIVHDYAHNTRSALMTDRSEFLGTLDDTEIKLFKVAQEASKDLKRWTTTKK